MIGKMEQQLSTEETRDPKVANKKARFEPRPEAAPRQAWDGPASRPSSSHLSELPLPLTFLMESG